MEKERTTINPDLRRERENCSFDPIVLTNALDGGSQKTYRRRHIGKTLMYMYLMSSISEIIQHSYIGWGP